MNTPDPRTPLRKLYDAIKENESAHWWDDHDNVVLLAYWMLERDHGPRDFVYLIEKPWKFTNEFEEALAEAVAEENEARPERDTEEVAEALFRQAELEQRFRAGFNEGRPIEGDE